MGIAIATIAGIIIGVIMSSLFVRTHLSGNLRVDHSIPEDDSYLFLELSKSVSTILKKKFVILKIRVEDFIPHK